uniref:Uncharacterized protein n=1 Tax=Xiphophorus couchianus TaxID=32473 RepID=A0A3B5MGB8_9TELE
MASNLEEELSCPVCRDIFRDPVLLSCSHSFCRACLGRWWAQKQIRKCPVCNWDSDRKEPTCNLVLKNTCEAFLLEREDVCQLHSEKLKLFCLDHQQPVCLICRDSKQHSGHVFRPAAEVAQDRREALRKSIMPLQEKLKLFTKRVLRDEEEVRVAAVKEEEEQKSLKVNEKIKVLDGVMTALYDTIKSAERKLRCKDAPLLQRSSAAGAEQQRPLPELPQPVAGALMDKVKHVVSRTPVVLDPNTAGPGLIICEDLAAVRRGSRQKLPGNPERFESEGIVSASRSFTAGVHFWTVEVADCSSWFVGVAEESFKRKKPIQFRSGLWAVCFSKEKYSYFSPGAPASFHVTGKLQAIRVHLDLEREKLSFTDPRTLKHICTFSHSWSEKMFPIFYVGALLHCLHFVVGICLSFF